MPKRSPIADYFMLGQYKVNPLALKIQFEKMILRWVARWAAKRKYWPTVVELAASKCRKLKKGEATRSQWMRAKHAFENVVCDLIEQGDLDFQERQFMTIGLTEQGWTKVPEHYERVNPPLDPLWKRRVRTAHQLLMHAERIKKHAEKLLSNTA